MLSQLKLRFPTAEQLAGCSVAKAGNPAFDDLPSRRRVPPATARVLRQVSPDRQRSVERRRRLAAVGPLPPALAAKFTTSEQAVLLIVGDENRIHGRCTVFLDAIAARAGCCRTTVKTTLRLARKLGLISVEERRLSATRNDSNVIKVISPEWKMWLSHGRWRAEQGGGKFSTGPDNQFKKIMGEGKRSANPRPDQRQNAARTASGGSWGGFRGRGQGS